MTSPTVEVFADIVCPFAHVGLRRFVDRRAEYGVDRPLLRVRAWPLELVNGVPFDGGRIAEHVAELRRQVAPASFAHFTPDAVPATARPAFALAAEAYTHGDVVGESVSLALRAALFDDGLDISAPVVLDAIGCAHGLGDPSEASRTAYQRDYAEGLQRGVQGSPHFFVGDRDAFCPSLRIDRTDDDVSITPDPARLDALLDDCFAPAS